MKVRIGARDWESDNRFSRKWELGSCFGLQEYDYLKTMFVERCCLPSGDHTLICHNKKDSKGWGDSSIEIQGQRYCDDFIGWKAMRKISVVGKNIFYLGRQISFHST